MTPPRSGSVLRIRRGGGIRRYVHTGGFNRLAGRSTAPGRPRRRSSFRRKLLFVVLGVVFWAVGIVGAFF